MAKIGVIPALINFNLRQQALIHTIQVADCKGAIYGLEVESGKLFKINFRMAPAGPGGAGL